MMTDNAPANPPTDNAPPKSEEDYWLELRGWLVTVAALFVNMAFQSAMQPPGWMPPTEIWSLELGWNMRKDPRYRALSPDQKNLATRAGIFQILNTVTFSVALVMMTFLSVVGKSMGTKTVWYLRFTFPLLSLSIAANFIVGITHDGKATAVIVLSAVGYAFIAILTIYQPDWLARLLRIKRE